MFAVIQTGGKQYKVQPGDVLYVDYAEGESGTSAVFSEVLFVGGDAEKALIGKPLLAGASVKAEVLKVFKGEKITIVKHKRRKNYRRTMGHRQEKSRLLITEVTDGAGGKASITAEQRASATASFTKPAKTTKSEE